MSKKKTLVFDWEGEAITVKFRRKWDFARLQGIIKEKTDLSLPNECSLTIDGTTIDSSETFLKVTKEQNKDSLNGILMKKSDNSSSRRTIECLFYYNENEMVKFAHEFDGEFDFDLFWDDLGNVLKNRDELFKTIEISREMTDQDTKENEEETDSDSQPQENVEKPKCHLKVIAGKYTFEDEMCDFTDEPSNVRIWFLLKKVLHVYFLLFL